MNTLTVTPDFSPWRQGLKDALPLFGGYIPVAISFGLISIQAGFSVFETILISTFIYAGASQFLFVAMVASGAPLPLVVLMTLLINARHMVYAPNIARYMDSDKRWLPLMHGLTDQVFALALVRLPQLPKAHRMAWYTSLGLLAWFSWIGGTALGAVAGDTLTQRWPLVNEALPFALPALFAVLVAPRCNSMLWTTTLVTAAALSMLCKIAGYPNAAIPLAALAGTIVFYAMKAIQPKESQK